VGGVLAQPPTRVLQHLNHLGLLVDGVGFMARSEIKDFSFADIPSHAAPETFAFGPCFFEDNLVRVRYMKWFVVHFCLWYLERLRQTSGDGVVGQLGGEEPGLAIRSVVREAAPRQLYNGLELVLVFFVAEIGWREFAAVDGDGAFTWWLDGFNQELTFPTALLEVLLGVLDAAPVHCLDEGASPVSRVQRYEVQLSFSYVIHDQACFLLGNLALPNVSPPDDHISPFQIASSETLVSIIQSHRADLKIGGLIRESFGDFVTQKVLISDGLSWLTLVPN
jgi:hypothetical protein